jgi:hypothetical protein
MYMNATMRENAKMNCLQTRFDSLWMQPWLRIPYTRIFTLLPTIQDWPSHVFGLLH